MNQLRQGYSPFYIRLQGKLFVMHEVPEPPTNIEFVPQDITPPSTGMLAATSTGICLSVAPASAPSLPLPLPITPIPAPLFEAPLENSEFSVAAPLDSLNLEMPTEWLIDTTIAPTTEPQPLQVTQDVYDLGFGLEMGMSALPQSLFPSDGGTPPSIQSASSTPPPYMSMNITEGLPLPTTFGLRYAPEPPFK